MWALNKYKFITQFHRESHTLPWDQSFNKIAEMKCPDCKWVTIGGMTIHVTIYSRKDNLQVSPSSRLLRKSKTALTIQRRNSKEICNKLCLNIPLLKLDIVIFNFYIRAYIIKIFRSKKITCFMRVFVFFEYHDTFEYNLQIF